MDPITATILLAFFGAWSFVFSGIEAGFLALNPARIRRLARSQYRAADQLRQHLNEPERFLWTILIGNTIANFCFVGVLVFTLGKQNGHGIFVTGLTILALLFSFYTFFELLPKMLVRRFPNRLTIVFTYPFQAFYLLISPAVRFLAWITQPSGKSPSTAHSQSPFQTRDDLQRIMQESAANLSANERALISHVMDLQNHSARSIMKPIDPKQCVSPHQTISEAQQHCQQNKRSRLLVRKQSPLRTTTMGIFHLKTTLFESGLTPTTPVQAITTPALVIPPELPLDEALQQMKATRHRLAIVGSQHQELGILTLTDILRHVFTDLHFEP